MNERIDAIVAQALSRAAASVMPEKVDESFLEKRLAASFAVALADEFDADRIMLNRKIAGAELPGWDPQPGWIDVVVLNEDGGPSIAVELKLDDVDHALWDVVKMVSVSRLPTVEAAYVAVAAPTKTWASGLAGVDLFQSNQEETWHSRYVFDEYREAWSHLLADGRGRPVQVAELIRLAPILRCPVFHYPPYELRALRVQPLDDDVSIDVVEAAPQPGVYDVRQISDEDLTSADLPSQGSDEESLYAFALTTNGYERYGTSGRCAGNGEHGS